jgi:methanogenic corrinoid protein MtbC1
MASEQNTSTNRILPQALEFRSYKQTSANINRLSRRLPEDVVINLAREVIRRVGSRDSMMTRAAAAPTRAELGLLCDALLSPDDAAAAQIVLSLRSDGTKAEDIHLTYLAGAARMLGDLWDENRIDFAAVTLGTGRLFAIMRGMRHLFEPTFPVHDKTAIFASVPGEDHTLGVRMATDLFRKEGWEIALKVGLDHDVLVAQIEHEPTGIVGLSIGGEHSMEPLSKLVVALHICCPQALILVCGQDVEKTRPVLELMGLDAIAATFDEAKQKMSELWDRKLASRRAFKSC